MEDYFKKRIVLEPSYHFSCAEIHTDTYTSTHWLIESTPNICGEKFFTRGNISTNVDTLLKGTHITIKWNKEREYVPHATLFIEKKSNIGRLRHGVCKSQNLGHPICFRVITHISFVNILLISNSFMRSLRMNYNRKIANHLFNSNFR